MKGIFPEECPGLQLQSQCVLWQSRESRGRGDGQEKTEGQAQPVHVLLAQARPPGGREAVGTGARTGLQVTAPTWMTSLSGFLVKSVVGGSRTLLPLKTHDARRSRLYHCQFSAQARHCRGLGGPGAFITLGRFPQQTPSRPDTRNSHSELLRSFSNTIFFKVPQSSNLFPAAVLF